MRGDIHVMPIPGDGAQRYVLEHRRHDAFVEALKRKDANIDKWPEFLGLLRKLGIEELYTQNIFPNPVLCALSLARGKHIADWIRRGERLQKRGIDPTARHKYREAMEELRALQAEAGNQASEKLAA